ncbi:matrixin family metalloprotease [Nocardioides sp. AN3]
MLLAAAAVVLQKGPLVPLAHSLGIGGPDRLLPAVDPSQESDAFVILKADAVGDPVTYDPCRPIHYVINSDGAPADYPTFILPAVNAAQEASGLSFAYDGLSDETWDDRQSGAASGPVVIAFPTSVEEGDVSKDTVGLGGSTALTMNGALMPHYVTGAIALKRDWFVQQSAEHHTAEEQAVVMHELGHVLGLGHVEDPDQLMYASNRGQLTYGGGDLNGLAKLGSGDCGS